MSVTLSKAPPVTFASADQPVVRSAHFRHGLVLAAILFGPLVGFLNAIALVPFLSVVADELGTSVAAVGQITALSMAVATGLGLVAGQFADRYGYRPVLVAGLMTVIVSSVGSAVAPNFAVLLVAGLIGALSRAVVAPISLTIAGTWFDGATRQRAIGLVSASISGAAVIGVPLMTTVAVLGGWRFAFLVLGLVAASAVVLTWQALPATRSASTTRLGLGEILGAYRPLLRHWPTMAVIGSTLLRSMGSWVAGTYVVAFLTLEHGLTLQQASLALAAGGGGMFVGSLLAGFPLRVLTPRSLLVASTAMGTCAIGASMALPVPSLWVFALIFAGFVLTSMANVAGSMLLVDETPAGRATTMSLNGAALSVSSALGGAVGGLLLTFGGYHAIGLAGPVLGIVAAAMVWRSRR